MKRFSDFAKEINITGDKIKIDEILNKEIEVINYKITESKYKNKDNNKLLTLQIKVNNEERVIFTGSNILIEQCEKYKNEMPFLATIKKINKFYTFS